MLERLIFLIFLFLAYGIAGAGDHAINIKADKQKETRICTAAYVNFLKNIPVTQAIIDASCKKIK